MLCLGAVVSKATPWRSIDLGYLYKPSHCVAAAQRSFQGLLGEQRIDKVHRSDMTVFADGIQGRHDALILCTHARNGGARATLVLHSRSAPAETLFLARRIDEIFEWNAKRVTQAWKDSYK